MIFAPTLALDKGLARLRLIDNDDFFLFNFMISSALIRSLYSLFIKFLSRLFFRLTMRLLSRATVIRLTFLSGHPLSLLLLRLHGLISIIDLLSRRLFSLFYNHFERALRPLLRLFDWITTLRLILWPAESDCPAWFVVARTNLLDPHFAI